MIIESPLEIIFRDLFYRLRGFANGHDVFLKLEGFNVTGSIKVKTAIGLIEDLEGRGRAKPDETVIIESSSGNLGVALSMVCAVKGYRFICVTDSNATRANIRGMQLYGAEVIVVRERDTAGGFLENRFKTINRLLNSEPNAIWLNQYENIANKQVHAEQTANEIAREFEHVDWIVTAQVGRQRGSAKKFSRRRRRVPIQASDDSQIAAGCSPSIVRTIAGALLAARKRVRCFRTASTRRCSTARGSARSCSISCTTSCCPRSVWSS